MRAPARASLALVAAAALASALVAPPATAAWQVSTTVSITPLTAGVLAAPAATCRTITTGTPLARISWPAVTGATGYRVVIGNTTNTTTRVLVDDQPGLSYDVTGTLLLTLLTSVLGNLLTGGTVYVTVTARTGAWTSAPSAAQNIGLSNIVTGLLGGVRCRP
ncbi:hypothetical protein [Microbacterium sp.]|uniref:hypothetical protein n=1 Tax=Microbacterium sp. TaxID=51671 RepID=UPI00391DB3C3